jgi:hypothetical protein
MSESYIQIPADSSGKKLRAITYVVGANTVHEEVIRLADASGNMYDARQITGAVITSVSGQPVTVASGLYVQGTFTASVSGEPVQVSGQFLEVHVMSGVSVGTGGGQISGAVIVSGNVGISGQWMEVHVMSGVQVATGGGQISGAVIVSGDVNITNMPTGIQVSGAVIVSGNVDTSVSGNAITIGPPTSLTPGYTIKVTADSGGVQLTSNAIITLIIKSKGTNTSDLWVNSVALQSGEGFVLEKGEGMALDIDTPSRLWVVSVTSGDMVSYIGTVR